jgi:hypothetical protein
MDRGPSNHEPGRVLTPTVMRPGEGPKKVQPEPVNYVEKAKAEMKWIEDIQKALKQVEDLQKDLIAANIEDDLLPIAENLRKKLAMRKENFEKYFSEIDKDNSETRVEQSATVNPGAEVITTGHQTSGKEAES